MKIENGRIIDENPNDFYVPAESGPDYHVTRDSGGCNSKDVWFVVIGLWLMMCVLFKIVELAGN